jgi:hypothetical protein
VHDIGGVGPPWYRQPAHTLEAIAGHARG